MSNKHGEFIWYELITSDTYGAKAFYQDILGWQYADSGQQLEYNIVSSTDADTGETHPIGGLMSLDEEMLKNGGTPIWLGYVAVDNIEQSIDRIINNGGSVIMPATDIPDVGRIALMQDPQGVPFYIMRGSNDATSLSFAYDKPRLGHCAWNELMTDVPADALQFYSEEFGWTKDGEMDLGPMGTYEFIRHNGVIGALMPKPEEAPRGLWQYYFRVANIDEAVTKINKNGGTLISDPQEIPGGDFTIQGIDPQGALFALVGGR